MAKYRTALPQLGSRLFLTDEGIETTLIFHEGQELPYFAAFHLFGSPEGRGALDKYFRTYAEIAKRFKVGLILESATWRANTDWGARLGYTPETLAEVNRQAIRLLEQIRERYETDHMPIVLSGCIGPRGDGYVPETVMSEQEATDYHRTQIETFAATATDMVCALTMNYVEEAIGIARAAQQVEMPVVISFTVETDGKLPTGQTLKTAIEQVEQSTASYPSYYMINCAHPMHFAHVLTAVEPWVKRIRGVRANASRMSHAELNESPELDMGNPDELGREYADLKRRLKHLTVMGGCCGTDHRHIEKMAANCVPLFA